MAKITFIAINGVEHTVDAKIGSSVMEGAVRHGVPGIDAECGGSCSCATCHVHVDPAWREATGAASSLERSLLDFVTDADAGSRLSCQIKVTEQLEGLVVRLPASQS
jgi:2Fe-2S ferredoxin